MTTDGVNPGSSVEESFQRARRISVVWVIAAVYVYFLLFAEFAFLRLTAAVENQTDPSHLVMSMLGGGGIFGSLLAGRPWSALTLRVRLALGCAVCGFSSMIAALEPRAGLSAVAALIGLSLGWTTVTLCAGLRTMVGRRGMGWCIGVGTGAAYAICNLPFIFEARPSTQAWIVTGGMAVTAGMILLHGNASHSVPKEAPLAEGAGHPVKWIIVFAALVWLDSAAFYIIQHTISLRDQTWAGNWVLYGNAATHLVAGVIAGVMLDRGRIDATVVGSFLLLVVACLLLSQAEGVRLAGTELIYTIGVSGYSVALVFVGGRDGNGRFASWLFALSGWIGSAVGIFAAQGRTALPLGFVIGTTIVVAGVFLLGRYRLAIRSVGLLAVIVMMAAGLPVRLRAAIDLIAAGREIYIREGCIHCHSQYVRPDTDDVLKWGPARSLEAMLADAPPLPGNRRQGPDLTNVGNRRTPDWNLLHLIDPRAVTPGSRMPSYAYLFAAHAGGKPSAGDALLAYLGSLGASTMDARSVVIEGWVPEPETVPIALRARQQFAQLCAGCHGADARGDGMLAGQLSLRPPDFRNDPWRHTQGDEVSVARIIKFGIQGSPMAGREYLTDADVVGLSRLVIALHRKR